MLTVTEYADKAMTMIDADIASGQVPATVRSFSELHDYVDANEYLEDVPWGTDLPGGNDPMYLVIEVSDEISARLAARGR